MSDITLVMTVTVKDDLGTREMEVNELAAILIENIDVKPLLGLGWTINIEVEHHKSERPVVELQHSDNPLWVACPKCFAPPHCLCQTKAGLVCAPHKVRWKALRE